MTTGWVDLHNHVIPAVDDGARDEAEAVAAVAALRGEGVRTIVATPHVDGSLTRSPDALARRLDELDAGWERLRAAVGPEVTLMRAAEVKLDAPEIDLSDERLRLGGSSAALVEFPHMSVPPRSAMVVSGLRRAGFVPLIAHPERYDGVDPELSVLASWLDAGGLLQVNGASLHGRYGERARAVAREILARGWAHCVASDFHARGNPRIAQARETIESWGGARQASLLFDENPARLLRDEPCEAVPPLTRKIPFRRKLASLLPW